MDPNSSEESDFSDSEYTDYKDKALTKLRNGALQVKLPDGSFRCPFCINGKKRKYEYKGIYQHASGVGSSSKRNSKVKTDHLALANYLEDDLAPNSEQPLKLAAPTTVVPISAQILKEELVRMGATLSAAEKLYGKREVKDKEIVWPPMVVIMNTQLEYVHQTKKWHGMGNEELLNHFKTFEAVRARHSYGPEGHTGMSVLIFESSVLGYMKAELLNKHFEDQGLNRDAWDNHQTRTLSHLEGMRQLYGYLATKRDMNAFNRHNHGKTELKHEIVSYQEKVGDHLDKLQEDENT